MAKIMIVDDVPTNIKVLGALLKNKYEIIVANNGEKAIHLAQFQLPDLILLDVMMPGLDGLSVCRILKGHEKTCEIPIIFITARNEKEDIVKAFEAGGQDYITKPFHAQELYARVRAQLELKQSRETLKEYAQQLIERNSQLQRALEQLEFMAQFDLLTNLPNRRYMLDKMKVEAEKAATCKRTMTIIMADIDNFKSINDTYGHDCGDSVLQYIANILRSLPRSDDVVARWGGEEFLFMLPNTDSSGGVIVAEKIRSKIEHNSFEYDGHFFTVTMTFGVAEYEVKEGLDGTIKKADDALYQGKSMSKNCVVLAKRNQ